MLISNDLTEALVDVEPVEKQDLTLMVLDRIRDLLERGILQAGSKLPTEHEMTRVLRISRPSLRQAYKVLNVLGVIRAVPGNGTYISESTSKVLSMPLIFLMLMKKISLGDVFEFRVTVERELAGLAAERARHDDIQAIRVQLDKMEASLADNKKYYEAEFEFHNAIASAAHSPLMLEIILILGELLWEVRQKMSRITPDFREDLLMHQRVFERISAKDPDGAREAMAKHFTVALQRAKKAGIAE